MSFYDIHAFPGLSLSEPPASGPLEQSARWSERHLQCVWYDPKLRPARLTTDSGEPVRVVQPGRWNFEAGPDFLGAEFRVGPGRGRLVRGDVEIHIRPSDWTAHGHDGDPRYAEVALHVTYYPLPPSAPPPVPPGVLSVSLREPLLSRRGFNLEDIDVAAYPHHAIPDTPRPCGSALADVPPDARRRLLRIAGARRLHAKAARLRARLEETASPERVFYEETLALLGSKRNAAPFRRIAEALPFGSLPAGASVEDLYALFLGTGGLLPDPEHLDTSGARAFAADLRARWFRLGGGAGAVSDPAEWSLSGTRPLNHPVRRLAAAAALFAAPGRIPLLLGTAEAPSPAWFKHRLDALCDVAPFPYWERRAAFDSEPGARPAALLGRARAAMLVTNLLVPLRLATDASAEVLLEHLPPEDLNAPEREAAAHLFGPDHNPALYLRDGLLQQGLLSIHRDFCLRIREGCARCPLARRLAEAAGKS